MNSTASRDRNVLLGAGIAALAALVFLLWLLYVAAPAGLGPAWVDGLPALNAFCNAASALAALAGVWAIRRGRDKGHRVCMLAALAFSALFLAGYIVFHHFRGETRYAGAGSLKLLYLIVLASHVLLSALVLPMLLAAVAFAGLGIFERHRRIARWALPLWLYVSVSGVAVYVFLRSTGSY